ncbi:MAG: hypothetical protein ACREOW_17125, partial [Thermodesulfobacteriota bacterium]
TRLYDPFALASSRNALSYAPPIRCILLLCLLLERTFLNSYDTEELITLNRANTESIIIKTLSGYLVRIRTQSWLKLKKT